MEGMIAGRTESAMPGLDIAEQRSWQAFLDTAVGLNAKLNHVLTEAHGLSLHDVRILQLLDRSAAGSERMGDIAHTLLALPSRVTRQIRRMEQLGLVSRGASPLDRRGVLATITDDGRDMLQRALTTYSMHVREHFLRPMSRAQTAAMGENCRRINAALQGTAVSNRTRRG